jgi:hypothetical protein
MSYRNPQQVVDTQSGKAFTDLQRTISGVFTGVADTYKKEQDEQAKKQQELADARKKQQAGYELQEARVYQGLAKANWSNKALDIKGVLGPLVNSYSDIMDQINSGAVTDPKTIASYRAQAADILTMPGRIGNIIEGMEIVSENIKDTVERMGSLGGMDPGSPGTMYEDMHVFMNQSPGQRLLSVKPDESGSLQGYITIKRNGKTTEYSEKQINAFISGKSNGISIIPDETSDMEGLTKSFVTMTDPLNANKTIYQDSAFLPPVTERRGDKMVTYKPVNRDLLINQAGPIISANLKAMSLDEKVAFGNNIASPSNRIFTLENVNTEDSKKILKDGYANYWLEKFAIKEQVLSSEKVDTKGTGADVVVDTSYIDSITIPLASGPAEEGEGYVDLNALERDISTYGFRVTKAEEVAGRGARTLTKSVEGADRTVTIYDTMTSKEVKDLMKFLETGKTSVKKVSTGNLPINK